MSTAFLKAKKLSIKSVQKEIDRQLSSKYSDGKPSQWSLEKLAKLQALTNYPTSSKQLRDVDVVAKSKILKAHLQEVYPDRVFSITTSRYSGGSSIDGGYKGDPIPVQDLEKITRMYSDAGNTDSMTDYFDYDNYCHVREDGEQYNKRYETFPECSFCGMRQEQMAVTCDDKNACTICRTNGNAGNSFKSIPEMVVN